MCKNYPHLHPSHLLTPSPWHPHPNTPTLTLSFHRFPLCLSSLKLPTPQSNIVTIEKVQFKVQRLLNLNQTILNLNWRSGLRFRNPLNRTRSLVQGLGKCSKNWTELNFSNPSCAALCELVLCQSNAPEAISIVLCSVVPWLCLDHTLESSIYCLVVYITL